MKKSVPTPSNDIDIDPLLTDPSSSSTVIVQLPCPQPGNEGENLMVLLCDRRRGRLSSPLGTLTRILHVKDVHEVNTSSICLASAPQSMGISLERDTDDRRSLPQRVRPVEEVEHSERSDSMDSCEESEAKRAAPQ